MEWYDQNKRDLPWRKNKNIYHVFLSEVMLQQTKVKTVIPYFNRWLNKYPTIESVALSNLEELLKLWEGLGYYSRCVNFYKSCIILYSKYNSDLPEEQNDFLALPGVGKYISAAVYSIARNVAIPAIDSNVIRVLSRILIIRNLTPYNKKRIYRTVNQFINETRPGDINQALMDLGSSICTPIKTECSICPISQFCKASNTLSPIRYPIKKPRRSKLLKHFIAGLIWNENSFLIVKRPINKMLGGLWEFPNIEVDINSADHMLLFKYIKNTFNIQISITNKITTINHSYSHFDISLTLYKSNILKSGIINTIDHCWIEPKDIDNYPFSKSNHKLFNILNTNGWNN